VFVLFSVVMESAKKRLLLIDSNDDRRATRVHLLTGSGYSVDVRDDCLSAERLNHDGDFDLIILALHDNTRRAIAYSDQLTRNAPTQPILLLTDFGVYVPPGTLSGSIESGDPAALIRKLASMLAGSTYVRELPILIK
jgi:AmiR/NasT family two-component response regulator